MKTKITQLVVLAIAFILTGVLLHAYFSPKEITPVDKKPISSEALNLTYANAEEYVLRDGEIHFFWLCDPDSADTMYVRDYVMKPLLEELEEDSFDDIKMVDFKEAPDTMHYRTSVWGVEYIPAFVAVQNVEKTMVILSKLSWDKDNPMTSADLKDWMYENGIWHGDYEKEDRIDQPID